VFVLMGLWGCKTPEPPTWSEDAAIWNGDPTSDFPAVGALTRNGSAFCTGTLIDEYTVLTAAHCVDYVESTGLTGVEFYTGPGDTGSLDGGIAVVDAASHPDWNGTNADIGVMVLDEPCAEAPMFVQVEEMLAGEWEGRLITLVGYGVTEDDADDSGIKMKTEVRVYAFDADVFFHYTAGTNACFGDSGGPALYEQEGRWWAVGVLSTVFGHARQDQVCAGGGGYQIRPDLYADWLSEWADYNIDTGDDDDSAAGDDDDTAGDDDDDVSDDDDASDDDGEGGCACSSTPRAPTAGLAWIAALVAVLTRLGRARTARRCPRSPRAG